MAPVIVPQSAASLGASPTCWRSVALMPSASPVSPVLTLPDRERQMADGSRGLPQRVGGVGSCQAGPRLWGVVSSIFQAQVTRFWRSQPVGEGTTTHTPKQGREGTEQASGEETTTMAKNLRSSGFGIAQRPQLARTSEPSQLAACTPPVTRHEAREQGNRWWRVAEPVSDPHRASP